MQRVHSTIEDVCQQEETRDYVILGTIERWMTPDIAWEAWPLFTVLGIDEIALQKGSRDSVVMVTARLSTRSRHGSRRLARADQGDAGHVVGHHSLTSRTGSRGCWSPHRSSSRRLTCGHS